MPAKTSNRSFAILWLTVILFFASLTGALLLNPAESVFLFPIYLPMILLSYLSQKMSRSNIRWDLTLLFVLAICLIFFSQRLKAAEIFVLGFDWMTAAGLCLIGSQFFERVDLEILDYKERTSQIESHLKSTAQENHLYSQHIANLKTQIGSRQKLASFTREMGTLLEPEKIKTKLLGKVQALFPSEIVTLKTSSLMDPVERWIAEKKIPILVKDYPNDTRLGAWEYADPENSESQMRDLTKSVIAAPLIVGGNLTGLIRIDSPLPNRFLETDLQQLELYSSLSILALENAHLFAKVSAMATKDALTGLATHRIFQEKLAEEMMRAARYHRSLSLVMLDIDHFKSINDRYGHLTGDQVLKDVGRILTETCRQVDFAARYGGEEFALVLPELTPPQTLQIAEDLRMRIFQHRVMTPTHILNISVSIGCSFFPDDAQIASQLIRKADERLYRAKSQGRNRVIGS